ncbi:SDR family NAD(P)-dependent oxidoreductase [Priestia endophytica]|uniref:SDR family NAD(P)-dependent oxidoreductase n=1 Tax=Priestia endophytica TaxID=135735 RepID=UPI000DCA87D9|nr:SDR family NAD(P)-dependent oxidoreductase [Priestia endophytica]RAS80741.1 3-oxoacyl-ACP reductase [Priestia endophytica]
MWEISHNQNLKGQVAIVTGATRGIGAACARALARSGCHIVIIDILSAEEIAKAIESEFPDIRALAMQVDIRKKEEVQKAVSETVQRLGRIDILVNNAGTVSRLGLEEMNVEDWQRDIDTNLLGTFLFMQAVIYPHMKSQGYGKIINISSISGIIGGVMSALPGSNGGRSGPAYSASKGGVIALTKWIAKEVGEHGIYCNSIAPGSVVTALTKGVNYPLDGQPIKRMGDPEDIAEAVVFLASPASNYVTGQVLKVCGGLAIG